MPNSALPVVTFSSASYANSSGGTSQLSEPVEATVFKAFFDDEIGWVFHGTDASDRFLYLSEHDLQSAKPGDVIMALSAACEVASTEDGYVFHKGESGQWTDGDMTLDTTIEQFEAMGLTLDARVSRDADRDMPRSNS